MNPWDLHPKLTRERLVAIGQLIQRGRNEALDRFNPVIGCDGWTVGCEAFAFQKHQIIQAAGVVEWLEILDASMQFVFCIDGIPARFYRGEPEDPTARTLKQSYPELDQLSLFSADELKQLGSHLLYRFAVETDLDGALRAVTFVVLSGEAPILTWQIPLDDPVTKISPLWVEGTEGVELPAPAVGVPEHKDGKDAATGA
jgi:hypothetical protein